eukprot:jgi/Chlat1/3771/Chrsp259S03913
MCRGGGGGEAEWRAFGGAEVLKLASEVAQVQAVEEGKENRQQPPAAAPLAVEGGGQGEPAAQAAAPSDVESAPLLPPVKGEATGKIQAMSSGSTAPPAGGGGAAAAGGGSTAVAPASSAWSGVLGRVSDASKLILSQRRPWTEMVDRTSFSRAGNLAEATSRVKRNVAYFRVNYSIFLIATVMLVMVMNPTSLLIAAFLLAAWGYLFVVRQDPLVIGGRTFSEREKLLGMAGITAVVVFFLTSLGSVLFMAVGLGVAGIVLHGAFRVPDDLFLDEAPNTTGGGFLSFLGAPTAPRGAANV